MHRVGGERRDTFGAIVQAPHRNPADGKPGGPAHREIWVKDLDGYTVVLASPDGEALWLTATPASGSLGGRVGLDLSHYLAFPSGCRLP